MKLFPHQQQALKCIACTAGIPALPMYDVLVAFPGQDHYVAAVAHAYGDRWKKLHTCSGSNTDRFSTRRLASRLTSALRKSTP